jgi:hypothetical protein
VSSSMPSSSLNTAIAYQYLVNQPQLEKSRY